ncbi:MAG TPA: YdeI/OmpD-associated family protein [Segeticoccus sp.]|jgi:uncharacterized protein YdeI (YjbR/CyaY-like superfamily)|nr:YdeI/OmpD-associated family protein [Segeticoccus sp.]
MSAADAPLFPTSSGEWRAWLVEHHQQESEVWLGYWRKHTGRPTLSWDEAVEEALCFGWIDGRRQGIDEERHQQRFTPRKAGSTWSNVNVRRMQQLIEQGRAAPAGVAAYEARRVDRVGTYSYENDEVPLSEDYLARLRREPAAWAFWEAQRPSYRKVAARWVMTAKRPETRERRIGELVDDCAAGRLIKSQRYGRR